jgi:hypothetical protein
MFTQYRKKHSDEKFSDKNCPTRFKERLPKDIHYYKSVHHMIFDVHHQKQKLVARTFFVVEITSLDTSSDD